MFEDSGAIAEFLEAHRDDERFGELWATYDRGYEVHVRYLADDFDLEIATLEQRLGRAVTIHRGGSSAIELSAAVEYLTTNEILYEPDLTGGVLRVFSDTLPTAKGVKASDLEGMDAITVDQSAPPKYQMVDDSRSGADVWLNSSGNWNRTCTAAAMWKGTGPWSGMTGYLWAAHCPNLAPHTTNSTFVDGGYSHATFSTMHTVCGPGGDWELIRFSVPKNEHETFLDKRFNPAVETPFRIAGGYYVGQPSFKVGLSTNGSTGTNMGSVAGYAKSYIAPPHRPFPPGARRPDHISAAGMTERRAIAVVRCSCSTTTNGIWAPSIVVMRARSVDLHTGQLSGISPCHSGIFAV